MEEKAKKMIIDKMINVNNVIIDTIYSLDEECQSQIFNEGDSPTNEELSWLKKAYISLMELISQGNNL